MEKEQKKIRWGIIGSGDIVSRWMRGAVQLSDEMEIVGIASRDPEHAKAAAERYHIPQAFTYDELLDRDDIDVYYVATPHTAHKEFATKVLSRGKAVLVEKPAGVNAAQFDDMQNCAKEHNAFLMEAAWTRFFPIIEQIKGKIAEGAIGDVRLIQAAFAFRGDGDVTKRLYNPDLAGGSLLDVGVYGLHFAKMILQKDPEALTGLASMDTDEKHIQVDEQAAFVARYNQGELAVLTSAVRTEMPDTAYIYGTQGCIIVPEFWKPSKFQVVIGDQIEEVKSVVPQHADGVVDEGYQFEIAHVNDCIRKGLKESPVMSFAVTSAVLRQCDTLRTQWGLVYPCEQ